MTSFPRLILFFCLSSTSIIPALAQTDPDSDPTPSEKAMRSWLESGDPRLVAWGAHDVAVHQDTGLVPELLALAAQWQAPEPATNEDSQAQFPSEQEQQRDSMAAIVDALIRMNAAVPPDTLKNLAPSFGNAVAVLLSRLPIEQAVPLALDFSRNERNHTYGLQYVSAAILALHPPQGFAADLLAKTDVRAEVFVILPGTGSMGMGGVGDCFGTQDRPNRGWPMTGHYILSRDKSEDGVLLVGGIDPVYAFRQESAHFNGDPCTSVVLGPDERVRLLEEMIGAADSIPWKTSLIANIEFESLQGFRLSLLSFIEDQQQMYRSTAQALEAKGLIEQSQIEQALPLLHLKLDDARGPGAAPIDQDQIGLPPRVEWAKN